MAMSIFSSLTDIMTIFYYNPRAFLYYVEVSKLLKTFLKDFSWLKGWVQLQIPFVMGRKPPNSAVRLDSI